MSVPFDLAGHALPFSRGASAPVAIGLAVVVFGAPALGQAPEQPVTDEVFFDRTEVRVVEVDVYVTDRAGRPIGGLTRDDFEVFERGRPVEITNFYAVSGGKPVESVLPTAGTQPAVSLPVGVAEVPLERRLHLVVYVDNFNLRPQSRNRTLERVRRFLRRAIRPPDQVMVVSYDRSLHVRQPFTGDLLQVEDGLRELAELSGIRALRDSERATVLDEIDSARDSFVALERARVYAESVQLETRRSLQALLGLIDSLTGLVGRKALLYVSEGLPRRAAEDLFLYVDERFGGNNGQLEAYNYDQIVDLRDAVTRANVGDLTLYTLDAGGMRPHSSVSAEYAGSRQGGGMAYIDTVRRANQQEPLRRLANDTGGVAILNTNAIEAGLGKVSSDFDNYYSLGFRPTHAGDGRYYDLEVKVRRKGVVVRHRHGYRDRNAETRMRDSTLATLHFGAQADPLGVEVAFGRAGELEGGLLQLPLTASIPIGKIALVPRAGKHVGRVQLSVAVMDGRGQTSGVRQQQPIAIEIPEADIEQARNQVFLYDLDLTVRRGTLRIAVGVRDVFGDRESFLRRTVEVSEP